MKELNSTRIQFHYQNFKMELMLMKNDIRMHFHSTFHVIMSDADQNHAGRSRADQRIACQNRTEQNCLWEDGAPGQEIKQMQQQNDANQVEERNCKYFKLAETELKLLIIIIIIIIRLVSSETRQKKRHPVRRHQHHHHRLLASITLETMKWWMTDTCSRESFSELTITSSIFMFLFYDYILLNWIK